MGNEIGISELPASPAICIAHSGKQYCNILRLFNNKLTIC